MAGEMTAMSLLLRWPDHAAGEGATESGGHWREMPRRPAPHKPPRTRVPEKLATDAIAHEEAVGGDKVRMTFWVILRRQQAEARAARAIREEQSTRLGIGDHDPSDTQRPNSWVKSG